MSIEIKKIKFKFKLKIKKLKHFKYYFLSIVKSFCTKKEKKL